MSTLHNAIRGGNIGLINKLLRIGVRPDDLAIGIAEETNNQEVINILASAKTKREEPAKPRLIHTTPMVEQKVEQKVEQPKVKKKKKPKVE